MVNCDICGRKVCNEKYCLYNGYTCPNWELEQTKCGGINVDGMWLTNVYRWLNSCVECREKKLNIFRTFDDLPKHIKDSILIEAL